MVEAGGEVHIPRQLPPVDIGNTVLRFAVSVEAAPAPEIFDTIQGEGRNIGKPTVFARLSGCNLQCSWCDTPYTWAFTDTMAALHDEGVKYDRNAEQVKVTVGDAVDHITGYSTKRLVITGGEPMLQQRGVARLAKTLKEKDPDYWIEVETNGTIAPSFETIQAVDQFNVSPKLSGSSNRPSKAIRADVMDAYAATPKADFKFVVSTENDVEEIKTLVARHKIKPEKVFLMPEGRIEEEVKANQAKLVQVAIDNGFNVTTRLHVLIFGAKRGT